MANGEFPRSIRIGVRAVGCLEAISTSGMKLAVSVPLMAVDKHQFQTHYLAVRCIVTRQHYSSLVLNWLRYLTQNSAQMRPVFQNVRQRAGWVDVTGPQPLYLFYPNGWHEATDGLSPGPDCAAKALAAGYLVRDDRRPQRKVSLPDNSRPLMYCAKGSILDA